MLASSIAHSKRSGLSYWAARVLEECDKASQDFAADPVHDLRVAIRRCRSMADGFLSVDPDPDWKLMKKSAKPLFTALGDLRDLQVMGEWVTRLSDPPDAVRQILLQDLAVKEIQLKAAAEAALHHFDRRHWSTLNFRLAKRTDRVPSEGLVFQHLALERWTEARTLHQKALRNRTQVGYHQLRIGIKRFRYTVENFLPHRHEKWARDLRDLQDALGEVHDFDVLHTMLKLHPEITAEGRARWGARLATERQQRLDLYRAKMLGKNSLWWVWRAELPSGETLQQAGMEKLRTWASFLDPDCSHSAHVTRIALQLYDDLSRQGVVNLPQDYRSILEAAAILHDVGRGRGDKGHRKRTYRMIRKLKPPMGWTEEQLHCAAVVARLHRGTLPEKADSSFVGLAAKRRRDLMVVAGMLRLANAFDWDHDRRILRISLTKSSDLITIYGEGLSEASMFAQRLAQARYLLEASCGLPILIRPLPARQTTSRSTSSRVREVAVGSS